MTIRPCIICGKPRDGTRIWCGSEECRLKLKDVPEEEIAAIREREVIEAFKAAPEGSLYIHAMERDE